MKKVLVLMLILGVASLASATMTLTVYTDYNPATDTGTVLVGNPNVSDALILVVSSDQATTPWAGGLYLNGTASSIATLAGRGPLGGSGNDEYTTSIDLTKTGSLGYVKDQTSGPYDGFSMNANDVSLNTPLATGDWFWVDMSCVGEGAATLSLYDGAFTDSTITIVPEPMTMALLGIGGLFLRRRK